MVRPVDIYVHADSLLWFPGESKPTSMDLSNATKLKDVAFRPESQSIEWVVKALQAITPKHRNLRQTTIHIPSHLTLTRDPTVVRQAMGETHRELWLDLDRLLVHFWESRCIHPKITCIAQRDMRDRIECFLPEITKREIIDLVHHWYEPRCIR